MSRESDIFTAGRYLDGDLTTFPELPLTRLPRRRLHCTAVTEGKQEGNGAAAAARPYLPVEQPNRELR